MSQEEQPLIARSLKKIAKFFTDDPKTLALEGVIFAALGLWLYFMRR